MNPNWLDIALSLLLLIIVIVYISIEQKEDPFDFIDQKEEFIDLQETAVILFWSTSNKPSQRGLQVLTRLYKNHPEVQVLGIYSSDENQDEINGIQYSLGIQYPLFASSRFPSSLPFSLVIARGEEHSVQKDLNYQDILSILNLHL